MGARRRRGRTIVLRNGRRCSVCGPPGRTSVPASAPREPRRAGLLWGAPVVLVALLSAFVLRWPPGEPDNPQHRAPIAAVAHYTFEDFANASH